MLLHGGLWKVPLAIDIGRETVALIRQNWNIISIPNTFAAGLACIGLLGPIGATLLSNGSATIATLNGLRPIMEQQPSKSFLRFMKPQNSCLRLRPRSSSLRDDEVIQMGRDDMSPSDVPLEGVSNPSSSPARIFGENRSVPVKLDGPLAATHVIHSIPGRVRLRVPTLKADSHLTRGLQTLLSAQAGVTEVTVAPGCQSVTVVHDPAMWTSKSLCLFLQSRHREELEQCASAALPEAEPVRLR